MAGVCHRAAALQREAQMAVRLVVAVTDGDWFNHLSARTDLEEVNFWAPSVGNFRVWCKRYLALGYRLGWQASRR